MLNDESYPKLVCEECTGELVMVAKFREKCAMSTAALGQLIKQLNTKSTTIMKIIDSKSEHIANRRSNAESSRTATESRKEAIDEPIEYDDENVEYVIFDSSHDFDEDNEINNRTDENISLNDEVCRKIMLYSRWNFNNKLKIFTKFKGCHFNDPQIM